MVQGGRPWVQGYPWEVSKNADFKKTGPPAGPQFTVPPVPLGIKTILGGFWHLSQLKFEEISPKIPRMQILRKLAPLLVRFTVPPVPLSPLGVKKFFGRFLASI